MPIMLMIVPNPWATMSPITAWVQRNAPSTIVDTAACAGADWVDSIDVLQAQAVVPRATAGRRYLRAFSEECQVAAAPRSALSAGRRRCGGSPIARLDAGCRTWGGRCTVCGGLHRS